MAIIEPERTSTMNLKKKKKYSAALRFWHWTNALVLSGSLLTVLINSTLFDRSQSLFIKSELQKSGTTVSTEQAHSLAHGMEDQVWGMHIYFGYALTALLALRLVSEIRSPSKSRFFTAFKKAYANYFILKKQRETVGHELLVKSLYLVFYLLILIMAVTGLLLAFEDSTGISRDVNHSIKELHGFCMYLILGFILLHVAGVFLAERKENKGIVSDMINGGAE